MKITLNTSSIDDYRTFLRIKSLPIYSFTGHTAEFPDEYASLVGKRKRHAADSEYNPAHGLFDYQADISKWAINKRKFAVFADCGLGKTLIILEFVRHAAKSIGRKKALIFSPLMVVDQTIGECERFYGKSLKIRRVESGECADWLSTRGNEIGITNYEALQHDLSSHNLGCVVLDESSILKSHYGAYGQAIVRLGRGIEWKMAATGTPAPNDRIEYANHAVFLDQYPTINAFLARFFVNRGQTDNRWELKPHALEAFYRHLSHWSIFLTRPATYGWKDNAAELPPIHTHIHHIELTDAQRECVQTETGALFASHIGGVTHRTTMAGISKGWHKGNAVETRKPEFVRSLVEGFGAESSIVWCLYNREQDRLAELMPDAANIAGDTPYEKRGDLVRDFQAGRRKVLISKPKILGFGLNLQIATRQVFSGLQDSYESFYQAVKRSNRYGSSMPLNVHIPVTELECPMVDTVLRKASRVQQDSEKQEEMFRAAIERYRMGVA